ncbi:MAG: ATP-binding protein [Spirochaetaceae bacterium]|nr:ATP-binding protein [Spirochaetaceae bacterium]
MHYAITDYVLDIVQNACEAHASTVHVQFWETMAWIDVVVRDNGRGMDPAEQVKALDPFHSEPDKHPGRKVGLGLPFLKQAAGQCGGLFELQSEPGKGTKVHFRFDRTNIDCPPVGDLEGLFFSALCMPGCRDMGIERIREGVSGLPALSYRLEKGELAGAVGGLEQVSSLILLKEYIRSQEEG